MADANPTSAPVTKPQGSKRHHHKKKKAAPGPGPAQSDSHLYKQERSRAGIFVTEKLSQAIARCKAKVEEIAAECRSNNRKFRDPEFNLADDRDLCLHSLPLEDEDQETFNPADVLRVSQIFDKPHFMVDGAEASDIAQGELGDCWFLSALAMLSSMPGLVEKVCVARDEKVGIYGFIFCRDGEWVDVIVDDQLCTTVAKFETLSSESKNLYHGEKDLFEKIARKGSKTLSFAHSAQENETWVPLIEKAYAKLHGDYASLSGGFACEALEDLTGGVSETLYTNDILDTDEFWLTNLVRVGKDRVFGCYLNSLDGEGSASSDTTTDGLYGGHAYSILAAVEYNGKRFVKVRNPWGCGEWKGRWSDGSKEWTKEWLPVLDVLKHQFGDDGSFIMEYGDFLNTWQFVERVQLFDESWVQSSHWLNVKARTFPSLWQHGDVSFSFTLNKSSPVMIMLSQADTRFWEALSGPYAWSFDFVLFKKGEEKAVARSRVPVARRSVSVAKDLTEGEYFIHVRLDRRQSRDDDYIKENSESWSGRKLARVNSQYAISQSIAANFDTRFAQDMVVAEESFADGDLLQLEMESYEMLTEERQVLNAKVFPAPSPREDDGEEIEDDDDDGSASEEEEKPVKKFHKDAKLSSGVQAGPKAAIPDKKKKKGEDEGKEEMALELALELGLGLDDDYKEKKKDQRKDKSKKANPPKPKLVVEEEGGSSDGEYVTEDGSEGEEEEEDDTDLSRPDIHPHVSCNGCGIRHIVGVRWKCGDCEDYDLCSDCNSAGVRTDGHKIGHRMIRFADRDSSDKEINRSCDGCAIVPIVGVLWRCLFCNEYDLCDGCHSKGVHPDDHPMVRAESDEDVAILADQQDEEEESTNNDNVLLGLRIFTKSHAKVDISGQLRHGSMLSWAKEA